MMISAKWVTLITLIFLSILMITGGRMLEEKPLFCASCHEMEEPYNNWISSGASKKHTNCIQCHSGPGISGIIEAELRGAKQLAIHIFTKPEDREPPFKFNVPDEFCTQCHPLLSEKFVNAHQNFQHEGKPCHECHKHEKGSRFGGEIKIQ